MKPMVVLDSDVARQILVSETAMAFRQLFGGVMITSTVQKELFGIRKSRGWVAWVTVADPVQMDPALGEMVERNQIDEGTAASASLLLEKIRAGGGYGLLLSNESGVSQVLKTGTSEQRVFVATFWSAACHACERGHLSSVVFSKLIHGANLKSPVLSNLKEFQAYVEQFWNRTTNTDALHEATESTVPTADERVQYDTDIRRELEARGMASSMQIAGFSTTKEQALASIIDYEDNFGPEAMAHDIERAKRIAAQTNRDWNAVFSEIGKAETEAHDKMENEIAARTGRSRSEIHWELLYAARHQKAKVASEH